MGHRKGLRKGAPDGLSAHEIQLRLVTDHAPVHLAHCDRDCRFKFVNRGYAARFGLTPEQVVGRRVPEVVGDDAYTSLKPHIEAALGGERVEFEVELPYDRIGRRVMHCAYAPEVGADGRITGFIAAISDVTDRKRTEEALRQTEGFVQKVLDSSRDSIKVLDLEGRLLYISPAGLALLEVTDPAPMLNRRWVEFWEGRDRQAAQQAVDRAIAGDVGRFEGYRPTSTGVPKWWDVMVSPMPGADGRPERLLAIARDITERNRIAQALRQREQHLRAVIDTTPECVKVVSRDGTLLEMNLAGLAMVEADSLDAVLGVSVYDLIAPEFRDAFVRFNERVCAGEKAGLEFEIVGLRGTRRVMETHAVPLRGADGALTQLAITRDITARRRAEEVLRTSEERFRSLGACSPVGIFMTDTEGGCTYSNPRCQAICGFGFEEGLGAGWSNWIHPDDRDRVVAEWQANARGGQEYSGEFRFRHADGTVRWVHVRSSPMVADDARLIGHVGTVEDITARRAADLALQENARQKDEFLAVLAHELRNPLAPIRTAIELMRLAPDDRDVQQRAHTVMDRQLKQLVRLVDDLLDVSRITRGKIELRKERVPLAAIIQSAVETSRPLVEGAGHELTVTCPPDSVHLEGDPTRLAQVFSNLLNNAAKYTERGGSIRLYAAQDGPRVAVHVCDTGVGIPADMLSRIFEMFTQVNSSLEKTHGGLGIGLTLAKRLVEMHGGQIEARSDGPGLGSEFIVRLPTLSPESRGEAREEPDAVAAPQAPLRRILVVDDNRDAVESLALALQMKGHEVRIAYDGYEAIEAADAFRPDVVLLDVGMPHLNGHATARGIRDRLGAGSPLFIALTGWGQEEDRRRSHASGFAYHLVKPVDPAVLDALLASPATEART